MHLLFSYGTLQLSEVQLALWGRTLEGQPDVLPGYKRQELIIKDPLIVELSRANTHTILVHTGNINDEVAGRIYELSEEELLKADNYEVEDYKRVLRTFKSGRQAWVYVM